MKKLFSLLILMISFSVASSAFASDVGSPPDKITYQVPTLVVAQQTPALNIDCVTFTAVDQEATIMYKVPILSSKTINIGNDAYFAYMDTHRRSCSLSGVNGYNNYIENSTVRSVQYNTDYGSNAKTKYPLKFLMNKSPC